MSICTGAAVSPAPTFDLSLAAALLVGGAARQVGNVERAVLAFYQRRLEAIDFDALHLHLHLLRQQRHHRHRHARRIERQESFLAAGLRQRQAAELDADIGPHRQLERAGNVQLALLLLHHHARQFGLELLAVEQRVEHAETDGDEGQQDAKRQAQDAKCLHAESPLRTKSDRFRRLPDRGVSP
jgi:hypothetical protein